MDLLKYVTYMLNEDAASKINFIADKQGPAIIKAYSEYDNGSQDADPKEVLSKLAKADPTKKGEAIQFIARMYTAKQFKLEDVNRLKKDLEVFFKFKSKIENKDLNSYKSLKDLYAAIAPFAEKPEQAASGKEEKKQLKSGAKYLINTPNFKAIIPKTEEAACYYSAGTKWCTGAKEDNQFKHYDDQGDLIIIIAGEGKDQRKFQLHYETESFMDETDSAISKKDISYLSSFPQYKELLDTLIKKHYFPEDHKE